MKPLFTFSALTLALSMHVGVANANDATEIVNYSWLKPTSFQDGSLGR